MSTTYPDLTRTNFPDNLDEITLYSDVSSASEISLVNQIQNYMLQGNFDMAQQILFQNPSLYNKFLNADKINKNRDIIIALERYLKTDYQQYIETKQQAWKLIVEQFKYIGDFSVTSTYSVNNMVSYSSSLNNKQLYICIQNVTSAGILPTNESYWRELTIKGDRGQTGIGLVWAGEYNNSATYQADNLIYYNNALYASLSNDNIGHIPDISPIYWTLVLEPPEPITYSISATQPNNLSVGDLWFKLEGETF